MRVDGQIYHNISNHMYTDVETDASYSQLYVLDAALADEIRSNHPANKQFYKETLSKLAEFLRENNQYAKSFKFLIEIEKEMKEKGE